MNTKLLILFSLAFVVCSTACRDENPETPTTYAEDFVQFEKIYQLGEQAEQLWPGYDYFRTLPAYIILSNEFEGDRRGYLLNPPEPIPAGSSKIPDEQSGGLNLYRNDSFLPAATAALAGSVFNFYDFKIGDVNYFVLKDSKKPSATLGFYEDFKSVDDNWLALTLVHEMFHVYQFAEWTMPPDTEQYFQDYPVNAEIATIELALFDLMQNVSLTFPHTSQQRKEQLSKFVVLVEELFRVDPTDEIIRRMVPLELFLEGSARYLEHYSAQKTIYPTIDSDVTHAWADHIDVMAPGLVRHFLSIRVWYHVGAGVLYQLKQEGVDIETQVEAGETPYSLARDYVNLTDAEKADILSEIKLSEEWSTFEERGAAMAL